MKPTCPCCGKHNITIHLKMQRVRCDECESDFPLIDLWKFYQGQDIITLYNPNASYSADYGAMN